VSVEPIFSNILTNYLANPWTSGQHFPGQVCVV